MDSSNLPPVRVFKSDRRAWIILALAATLLPLASWAWRHRRILPPPTSAPALPGSDFRLAVLDYGRILAESKGTQMGQREFQTHLEALLHQGYHPVSASQVEAAYLQGASLPEKPVMLLFSGGYLSTYQAVHPVLARHRIPATMFLETSCQDVRSPAFLFWDRLQIMLDSGIWELGTHGQRVLGGSKCSGENAFESSRISIEQNLHHARVAAYLPLASLTPQLSGQTPPKALHLAFKPDLFGINAREEDPRKLHCLEVQPNWSPEELIRRMDQARNPPTAGDRIGQWIPGEKDGLREEGQERLLTRKGGTTLWCAGSQWLDGGWHLRARMKLESGSFWIIQKSRKGNGNWRLGGDPRSFLLQSSQDGSGSTNVARISGPGEGWHDLHLIRRGSGLWIEWDGKPASRLPMAVPSEADGLVGIRSGSPEIQGNLRIAQLDLRPTGPCPHRTEASPTAADIQRLSAQASTLTAICPQWGVQKGPCITFRSLDRDRLSLLKGRFACPVLPAIRLANPPDQTDGTRIAQWLQACKEARFDGLVLDMAALSPSARQAWRQLAASIPDPARFLALMDLSAPSSLPESR